MRLADYVANAIETLKLAGVDNPQLDTRLLAGHALGIDRAELLSQSQRELSDAEQTSITALITRRAAREPVARIIGTRGFWGLEFGLNEATLEPRPDSETLVEAILKLKTDAHRILDLGTGSGCLLLSLLHEFPSATGLGIDINPRAVEQAAQNAVALKLNNRAAFQTSNWLENITGKFDIIISNPPYIPHFYIEHLMPEVRDHDPMLALDGGTDGLAPYRHLIPQLPHFLTPNGILCFEIGITQALQVATLLQQSNFQNITTHKDLGGIDRCITALTSLKVSER